MPTFLIMARTDARAVQRLRRGAGALHGFRGGRRPDIIFFEAPETEDEMRRFCSVMKKPCMANMVPGGRTPVLPPAKLQEVGYKLALYPVMLLSSAIFRHSGDARRSETWFKGGAAAAGVLHRSARDRGLSRTTGARDPVSGVNRGFRCNGCRWQVFDARAGIGVRFGRSARRDCRVR